MAIHDISGRAGAPHYRRPGQHDLSRVAIILAVYAAAVLAAVTFADGAAAPGAAGIEDWHGNVAASSSLK